MTDYKIFHIKNIGEIKIVKSKRARRMSIKVKPFEGVTATIPYRFPYKKAEHFLQEKHEWIKSGLLKTSEFEDKLTVFTEKSNFKAGSHQLIIEKWDKKTLSVRVVNNKIQVKYPATINIRDEQIQKGIRKGIERALLNEAKLYLPQRTAYLAKKTGLPYQSVAIKNTKSRWGSCTGDNRIFLNLHLMRLQQYLSDYVIIHELCHTIQKNHSKKFWALMEKVLPGANGYNKELKAYQIKIF